MCVCVAIKEQKKSSLVQLQLILLYKSLNRIGKTSVKAPANHYFIPYVACIHQSWFVLPVMRIALFRSITKPSNSQCQQHFIGSFLSSIRKTATYFERRKKINALKARLPSFVVGLFINGTHALSLQFQQQWEPHGAGPTKKTCRNQLLNQKLHWKHTAAKEQIFLQEKLIFWRRVISNENFM